jgi:hypothetical protein
VRAVRAAFVLAWRVHRLALTGMVLAAAARRLTAVGPVALVALFGPVERQVAW